MNYLFLPEPNYLSQVKASEFQSSTKIEALLDEIQQMNKADPTAKVHGLLYVVPWP